ncbi:hypothetical protein LzC2_09500 [Planctomycetes bacterium LzC2]|uniref:DUF2200 domain-containing protein n=1 Tax=Alienimonas chondri TaxID=2681879 RepID=A0ABX1VAT5_9PLAN|nr:DUF2200 domain-containing protein [Alienimonas chondri]NNJ24888.1 hypothetical protein [Alienimonas chondri]
MTTTKDHDERVANLTFASVYPHYISKVEKKGRTVDELHQVITWLTGFEPADLERLISEKATFERFFAEADLNPHAQLITGTICGYRIEEIVTPLTRQARYLDKLVDELARGRKMEKILRRPAETGRKNATVTKRKRTARETDGPPPG